MKKVIIKEGKLPIIKESLEDNSGSYVTFYKFFTEIKKFIKGLLEDPLKSSPSEFFKENGISRSVLINRMLDRGILTKKETINEPNDANGKKTSMHYLKYSVPRNNFERKIKRLYSYFFENKNLDENHMPLQNNVELESAGTYIFCKDEDGEWNILAGKRGITAPSFPGKYNVPTGMRDVEDGDDIRVCAQREVKEETDLEIPLSMFKVEGMDKWGNGHFGANCIVVFNDDTSNHEPGHGDGENEPFEWIPMDEIDNIQWAYGMNETAKEIFSKI